MNIIHQVFKVVFFFNKLKMERHMSISIDTGKEFNKSQYQFLIKKKTDKIFQQTSNRRELGEQTPGDSKGHSGSLVCCSPWGHRESDMAKQQQEIEKTYEKPTDNILLNSERLTIFLT